tara:strand:- start:3927 stop:6392 length:2466 start_codon:yes stop_codon:yes gene_type:complete
MYSKVRLIIIVGLIWLFALWLFPLLEKSDNTPVFNDQDFTKVHATKGRYQLMPEYTQLRDQLADWILRYSDIVLETKSLLEIPKPRLKGLKLVLARKGKILEEYGKLKTNYHDPSWLNQFILGIRKKGKVFKSKSEYFFDRSWEWNEFQKQWGRLMVAKTGKTFKLWSIQGSPDHFLLIIYDLALIDEVEIEAIAKQKIPGAFYILIKYPLRFLLSALMTLVICVVLIYPLTAFYLCRYDILLGICLCTMIIFVRDSIEYVMEDWFSSQEQVIIKQTRNQMSDMTVDLLNNFRRNTDMYGRQVAKLFKQKIDWNQLEKNNVNHLKEISNFDLYTDVSLITTVGIWELSNKFQSYSRNLIDVFAESSIKQLIRRDFTESEKKILSGRAGIMDIWVTEEKRGHWRSRSDASANIGTFRYVSFGQNDYGLFWTESVSADREFAGYLVLHNSTLEMLKTFIKSNEVDAIWKTNGLGAILCDENDRILHQWGSIDPEIQNRFRMRQIQRLTKGSSEWIKVKLSHAAFGKKNFHVYADKSQSISKLIIQRTNFTKSLNVACSISILILILTMFRVKNQLSNLLIGLKEVTNSKFGIQLKNKGWDETSQVINNFNQISKQLLENQKLSPFVAGEILNLFRDENGSLQREIMDNAVVLFSDIRSFTSLSEQQSPQEVVEMLNQYFEIWAETVEQYGGIIERFVGDAIQIIFFESKVRNTHQTAIECAIKVREKILCWNIKRQRTNQFEVKNGIGIASGKIRFTILGNSVKRHFVSQGTPVFHAEKLESISVHGRFSRIISDSRTMGLLNNQYDFEQWTHENQVVFELKN